MIIAIGGVKGGTGKTTLALNLVIQRVIEGRKVLLLDSGISEIGFQFSKRRKDLGIPTNWDFMLLNKNLHVSELELLSKNYDDIIIDIHIEFYKVYNILCLSDILILPLQICPFSIQSLKSLMPTIDSLKLLNKKLKVFGLLTCVKPRDKDEKKNMNIISDFIPCLPTLYRRIAYDRAAFMSLGVLEEKKRDYKCCNELNEIFRRITFKDSIIQKLISYLYKNHHGLNKQIYYIFFVLILIFYNIEFSFSIINLEIFSNYFNFCLSQKKNNDRNLRKDEANPGRIIKSLVTLNLIYFGISFEEI